MPNKLNDAQSPRTMNRVPPNSSAFDEWWTDMDNGCPPLHLDNDYDFARAVWDAAIRVIKDRQLLAIPSNDLLGTSWIPKTNGQNLPWKVTDIFVSINGKTAVQIEKYQGGRNSPSIITTKRLRRFFDPLKAANHRK